MRIKFRAALLIISLDKDGNGWVRFLWTLNFDWPCQPVCHFHVGFSPDILFFFKKKNLKEERPHEIAELAQNDKIDRRIGRRIITAISWQSQPVNLRPVTTTISICSNGLFQSFTPAHRQLPVGHHFLYNCFEEGSPVRSR